MREIVIDRYTRGGFQNPFTEGVFIYDHELYKCNEHQQMLLYLFLYGLTSNKFIKLFQIYSPRDGGWVVLKKRLIWNLLYFIDKDGGVKETNEYTTMMNDLYKEAKKRDLISLSELSPGWLPLYILQKYPNIIKELHESYPKIRVFL